MIITYKVQCEDCGEFLADKQVYADAKMCQMLHEHALGHQKVTLTEDTVEEVISV